MNSVCMRKFDNDDEPLPFVSIAALTANVLRYLKLDEQKPEDSDDKPKRSDEAQDHVADSVARIEQFELRARGITPHRTRRHGK